MHWIVENWWVSLLARAAVSLKAVFKARVEVVDAFKNIIKSLLIPVSVTFRLEVVKPSFVLKFQLSDHFLVSLLVFSPLTLRTERVLMVIRFLSYKRAALTLAHNKHSIFYSDYKSKFDLSTILFQLI